MKKESRVLPRLVSHFLLLSLLLVIVLCAGCDNKMSEESEPEVVLFPGITKILYDNRISYRQPDLFVSKTYSIIGKEEERAIMCFFFLKEECVGELIWYGDLESKALDMDAVAFCQEGLDVMTEIYQNGESICVACISKNEIRIMRKEGEPVIVLKGEETGTLEMPEITREAFKKIILCPIYREPVLD